MGVHEEGGDDEGDDVAEDSCGEEGEEFAEPALAVVGFEGPDAVELVVPGVGGEER